MSDYPNLAGVAGSDLVEKVSAGKYTADYINWSRTMQMLRDHAPGWLPELVQTAEGGYVHRGGVGGFLLIRFVHQDGTFTPGFPQAIMDNRNDAIPLDKITARDITDTHRRGLCMAAALAFGLAYELWAKMPLESGYSAPTTGADKSGAGGATAEQAAAAETAPRDGGSPAPGQKKATKAAVKKITDLIPKLAELRGIDPDQVRAALETDAGTLDSLTADAAEQLHGKMVRWQANLAAAQAGSAGEQPQSGADGAPEERKPPESSEGAPAESQFKQPKGPRGGGGVEPDEQQTLGEAA